MSYHIPTGPEGGSPDKPGGRIVGFLVEPITVKHKYEGTWTHLRCEEHDSIEEAIAREKAMKAWKRAWKIELIEGENPEWDDLFSVVL